MLSLTLLLAGYIVNPVPFPAMAETRFNLIRARPEVEAELVWPLMDVSGRRLTGKGIVICDIDGAPDIFHPMFFKDDRGRFGWIDVDGDGHWSPGDAVDIDGNGMAGPGEGLAWLPYRGEAPPGLDPMHLQAGYDFLYQDANGNGVRDFGPPAFTESDPCYGEGLFIIDDADGNGELDAGENLIGLKTSKIRAIYDHRVYRRGVDLIEYRLDSDHGTLVGGVLVGGWTGKHRLTGIAPDAELLCAVRGDTDALRWAREEEADIILWEYGGPFSDGSSEIEEKVNELARDGMLFIAAAGNDRAPGRHVAFSGEAMRTLSNRDSSSLTLKFVRRGPGPAEIRIEPPGGPSCVLPIRRGYIQSACVQGFIAESEESSRGTTYLNMRVGSTTNVGNWTFSFPGFTGSIQGFVQYGFDDPGAAWIDGDGAYTVTSPGTADSAITVAAYENFAPADIAWFSGEGPSLDGRSVVDIAAPGVRVLSALPNGARFGSFTGTSAAIPFVAGAAALLKQMFPGMESGRLRSLLAHGAARDSLTTDANRWGAGRLRIHESLVYGLEHPLLIGADLEVFVFPNPTQGPVEISWPSAGGVDAEVRVFSVRGALIWEKLSPSADSGRMTWAGVDLAGRRVPAGVYFVHVKMDRRVGVARCVSVE